MALKNTLLPPTCSDCEGPSLLNNGIMLATECDFFPCTISKSKLHSFYIKGTGVFFSSSIAEFLRDLGLKSLDYLGLNLTKEHLMIFMIFLALSIYSFIFPLIVCLALEIGG